MNEVYTDFEGINNGTNLLHNGTGSVSTGTYRQFETGAQRDTGVHKEDYIETISWLAMQAYAKYMTAKAKVYGRGNWRKGIPEESYEESLLRHIQKYLANKYDNAGLEPDEDHLAAAWFNLQGLIHEREKKARGIK